MTRADDKPSETDYRRGDRKGICEGSLYVQLLRCRSLSGIMLVSKARGRDLIGNKVPENMMAAEERSELLSNATIREAES